MLSMFLKTNIEMLNLNNIYLFLVSLHHIMPFKKKKVSQKVMARSGLNFPCVDTIYYLNL